MLNAKWLKQILSGDKKLLKAKEARHCNPPKYDEISVANLYNTCIVMEGMSDYFPDEYPKGRTCAREYFFTVLATLHPDYTDKLLKKCKQDRYGAEMESAKKEAIVMSAEWEQQLKEFPQFTSKLSIRSFDL